MTQQEIARLKSDVRGAILNSFSLEPHPGPNLNDITDETKMFHVKLMAFLIAKSNRDTVNLAWLSILHPIRLTPKAYKYFAPVFLLHSWDDLGLNPIRVGLCIPESTEDGAIIDMHRRDRIIRECSPEQIRAMALYVRYYKEAVNNPYDGPSRSAVATCFDSYWKEFL